MKSSKLIHFVLKRLYIEYRKGLWTLYRRLRKSVDISTKQGEFTLPLEIDDPISKSLFCNLEYELDLIHDAMCFIRNKYDILPSWGTVLDIGANNGVISIGMINTGEAEKAIAIEPEPRNYELLLHNVSRNNFDGVITCLNYAVSDSKSIMDFELSKSNYGDHRVRKNTNKIGLVELNQESSRQVINVECDTLDSLLSYLDDKLVEDISVVWIDVQGYEGYVFLGGKNIFSRGIPVVSELWPYGIQRSGMSQETFCNIAGEIWSAYWVKRGNRFVKYPIDILNIYFEELGYDGDFGNVIFT